MIPIVTINKGMFPDNPPFETIRIPFPDVKIDGSPVIIGYTWINTLDGSSGYVPGNASCVLAGGSPVILLKDLVPTHIIGNGPVLGV